MKFSSILLQLRQISEKHEKLKPKLKSIHIARKLKPKKFKTYFIEVFLVQLAVHNHNMMPITPPLRGDWEGQVAVE